MTYARFKTDLARAETIREFYHAQEIQDEKKPYEYFFVKKNQVIIHAYKNKKDIYTIVFQSEDDSAIEEANQFSNELTITRQENVKQDNLQDAYFDSWEDFGKQIGSDEVGVGDFFGPLVVCATYIEPKDIDFLEKYQVNDSKKMKDPYILSIGPVLKRRLKNYVIMLSADKLSRLKEENFNIHKAMAKCHNLAQKGLMEKYQIPEETIVYIDQFAPEEEYKRLVQDDLISNPLYFRTRAESYFPSVAASSVIARSTFLKEWQRMEEDLHTSIPKGASSQVDKVYGRLSKTIEKEKLDRYVKRFFSNYKKD